MPYIDKRIRDRINLGEEIYCDDVGTLNYCITKLVHHFITGRGLSYAAINAVIGVLECAKLELYRQIAAGYEDQKKNENGSISELDNDKINK